MKKKFDEWVEGWGDGTLLIYFTALHVLSTLVILTSLR